MTLGDNTTYEHHYYNRPLEKDAAYWVVVVTEKRSGKLYFTIGTLYSQVEKFLDTLTMFLQAIRWHRCQCFSGCGRSVGRMHEC